MRKWDIVNVLEPEVEITQSKQNRAAIQSLVTSAVKAAFVIGVAVASSAHFKMKPVEYFATPTANVGFVNSAPLIQAAAPKAQVRISSNADTQFGQSTSKLAQLFQAYFVQAPDEEAYDDDYSFS